VFLRNSTIAEDLEPEYITVSDDGRTAWVTCQENNCIAEVDVDQASVTKLIALGFKNQKLVHTPCCIYFILKVKMRDNAKAIREFSQLNRELEVKIIC
jgi:hypothetical protein